jgi:hypothetical protein
MALEGAQTLGLAPSGSVGACASYRTHMTCNPFGCVDAPGGSTHNRLRASEPFPTRPFTADAAGDYGGTAR